MHDDIESRQGNRPTPLLTPRARFFQTSEVAAGRLSTEHEDQAFQYVALYEHRIGISVRPIGDHVFIISNGFLTSHAYNLALTWLWRYRAPGPERAGLGAALRHNYKKFFAECVLAHENRLIGRALLIETLMYEQDLMQPMFDAVAADPGLGQIASEIAQLMSSLAAQHELTHYWASFSVN